MKAELVVQIQKMLAEMIREAFMKKGGGGKVSLANFRKQAPPGEAAATASAEPAADEGAPGAA